MAKLKPKLELKKVLLAKGEYVAMGVAGLFLALLLVWGASKWAGAENPDKISKELAQKAQTVHAKIQDPTVAPDDPLVPEVPDIFKKPYQFPIVPPSAFPATGPAFDPIAKPDTKRENPSVVPIDQYQVDLIRSAMPGYDIIYDNEGRAKIGVIVAKQVTAQDKERFKALSKTVIKQGQAGRPAPKNPNPVPMGPMGQPVGPMGQPVVPPGAAGSEDGGGRGPVGFNPLGGPGGGYDAAAQRVEKSIEYVPLLELDKAVEKGKIPATTVVPLRMVTIHAEIPYKKQVEEIKRALRLPTYADAQRWGPLYDGYEVQRKVSRVSPGGKQETVQDWARYEFEDRYADLIARRKFADHFEDGYLSYFIRYDMALALPLPLLVKELGVEYPKVRLEAINNTVEKLKQQDKPPDNPSALLKRLGDRPPRKDLYTPQSGAQTGASGLYGGEGGLGVPSYDGKAPQGAVQPGAGPFPVGPGVPPRPGTPVRPGDEANQKAAPPVEIEHLLLRFIDVDVRPGLTYEYRVRLRMLNPNYGQKTEVVANPAYAKKEYLESPWTQVRDSVTVPVESFLYAADPAAYRKKVEDEYPKEREMRARLQAKDNQVVVEMLSWMEQVRTDAGGKREPVGAWVVADMPVGRGEYVGRRQYVKLPLWSSEANQYVFREVADTVLVGKKGVAQPKGWLVDFSTKSVLVDFEGGKVSTPKPGANRVDEDVAAEMLIVRPDGKLMVRNSLTDEADERNDGRRKRIVDEWEKWTKEVEKRKAGGTGDPNEFGRPGGEKGP